MRSASSTSWDLTTVESDRTQVLLTIDLVERFRLTAFDAAYLALAQIYGSRSGDARCSNSPKRLGSARSRSTIGVGCPRPRTPYEHDVTWPDYKGASAYLAKLRVEARAAATS